MIKCTCARVLMSESLDGTLSVSDEALLRQHLHTCAQCCLRWPAMQRVSSLFHSAGSAEPAPDFTARVMQRVIRLEAERTARPLSSQSVFAWSAMAVSVLLLLAVVALYGAAPSRLTAEAGLSLDYVGLSMRISESAIRAATVVDNVLVIPASIVRAVPLPALAMAVAWLVLGTLALAYTVASVVAAYQPLRQATAETTAQRPASFSGV